jgi:hypothetical protein
MDSVRAAITRVLEEIQPATVRQVFYQLVSQGVVDKTEAEYKSTVVRLLTAMRRAKEIPFGWIAAQFSFAGRYARRIAATLPSRNVGQPGCLRRDLAGKGRPQRRAV